MADKEQTAQAVTREAFLDRLERQAEGRLLFRETRIEPEGLAQLRSEREEGEQLPRFSISSQEEVERSFWGTRWVEILDHSPRAVRMHRFSDGAPMLVNHRRDQQAGAWKDATLDSDGRIRATPVFSRSRFGQEIRDDVADGIRNKTSVGYLVHDAELAEVRVENDEQVEVWRITDWEPIEGSIVAIPADVHVGAGRSQDGPPSPPASSQGPVPASEARETTVENNGVGTAPSGADSRSADVLVHASVDQERERNSQIMAMARAHTNVPGIQDLAARAVSEGWTEDRFGSEVLRSQGAQHEVTRTLPPSGGGLVDLPSGDRRRYSISSAIRQAIGEEKEGLEMEVSAQIRSSLPSGTPVKGGERSIFVPVFGVDLRGGRDDDRTTYRTSAPLNTGGTNKGKETVFAEYGGFLELLRTRAMVMQLGATFLPGLRGNVSFVKQTGAAVAQWVEENPTNPVSDSELSLALVILSPKSLMGSTYFTRQLLRQNVVQIDEKVETDLAAVHARALDLAAAHGTGLNNQPKGIYAASGVTPVSFDGLPSYTKIVEMETAVAAADADLGVLAYLTTPEVRGLAKVTETFPGSSGRPVWTGPVDAGEMNGYRAAASNQLRKNLGTEEDEHALIYGAWDKLMIGEWGVLEIIVDEITRKKSGIIEITSFQMADVQLAYGEAFSKATGLNLIAPEPDEEDDDA